MNTKPVLSCCGHVGGTLGLACSHEYNSGLEPKAEYDYYDIPEVDPDAQVTQWDLKGERRFSSLCAVQDGAVSNPNLGKFMCCCHAVYR